MMKLISKNPAMAFGGVLAVGLLVWILFRGFGGVAKDAARAVVDTAGGVVAGTAEGVGSMIGIPVTELDACEAAIKSGDSWTASFKCPMSRFLRYKFTGE